jgi:hypothetical protein
MAWFGAKGKDMPTSEGKTTISVREAVLYDIAALEAMLLMGAEETDVLPPYDQLHSWHVALNMIESGCVFIAEEVTEDSKQSRAVGCLMLDARTFHWNPSIKVLESVHYYVLPPYRARTCADGTPVWRALLEAGKELADIAQTTLKVESFFSAREDNRAEVKDELFKQAGYAYMGGNFLYVPKPRAAEKAA